MAMLKYGYFVSVGYISLFLCKKLANRSNTNRMDSILPLSLVAEKIELNIVQPDNFIP